MKPHYYFALLLSIFMLLPGHSRAESEAKPLPKDVMVEMKTSLGDVLILLDIKNAPISGKNFLQYVDEGFYDGTIFHRVIPGFMVQGGGFNAEMQEKPSRDSIKNEAANGVKNLRGTLAMARTNVVNSATNQFFINTVDNGFLDHKPSSYGYAVFGKVVQGMSIIKAIEAVPTGRKAKMADVPKETVTIISIKRQESASK